MKLGNASIILPFSMIPHPIPLRTAALSPLFSILPLLRIVNGPVKAGKWHYLNELYEKMVLR